MSSLPQLHSATRAPRAHLAAVTPAVLRFEDGQRTAGSLQVVSLTGGLLSLSNPLSQGSQVKLMFLTGSGSVLGGAEMLSPVASNLQPFRFIELAADDQRKLGATIQSVLHPDNAEQAWIKKLRDASAQPDSQRGWRFKLAVGAVGLVTLGLAAAIFLLRLPWLK
ncbi:MAG: hypothetical protein LAO09_09255 [Acidobacteriia bacterium]|nr:hypothetical protein [Terriglobia bacterium]